VNGVTVSSANLCRNGTGAREPQRISMTDAMLKSGGRQSRRKSSTPWYFMVVQGGRVEVEQGKKIGIACTFEVFKCEDMTMLPHHRGMLQPYLSPSLRGWPPDLQSKPAPKERET